MPNDSLAATTDHLSSDGFAAEEHAFFARGEAFEAGTLAGPEAWAMEAEAEAPALAAPWWRPPAAAACAAGVAVVLATTVIMSGRHAAATAPPPSPPTLATALAAPAAAAKQRVRRAPADPARAVARKSARARR